MDHDLINKTIDGCGCFLLPLTGIKRVGGRGKRTQPWSQCAQAHSPRCKPASAAAYNAHAGTRRHGKTTCRRQYKARRDETRRDETGRGGTRQDKTRQARHMCRTRPPRCRAPAGTPPASAPPSPVSPPPAPARERAPPQRRALPRRSQAQAPSHAPN
jgi:hypothetical protein